MTTTALTIRHSTPADDRALDRLAALDSSTAPAAPVLLAEVDGQLIAAVSARDGRAIADPFTRSAEAVALLRRRARQLGETRRPQRRPALRLRHA